MSSVSDSQVVTSIAWGTQSISNSCLTGDGTVNVSIQPLNAADTRVATINIKTQISECSWNVHASAKLVEPTQVSNRAKLVDTASDRQAIKIGSAIFLPTSPPAVDGYKLFVPEKLSLYIDNIERHNKYLSVSSRQDVTSIPVIEDNVAENNSAESKDKEPATEGDGSLQRTEDGMSSTLAGKQENSNAKSSQDDSSDDEPSDDIPEPDSESDSNQFSAEESWSEASTEYDSDIIVKEFRPQRPRREKISTSSASGSDDSDSHLGDESSDDDDDDDDDADVRKLVEDSNKMSRAFDWEEDDHVIQVAFADAPPSDNESNVNDFGDSDYPEGWDDSDFGFQAVDFDSDSCSECGDDGAACKLPSEDGPISGPASESANSTEREMPVGTPMSQIHIYDVSKLEADSETKAQRIFRFARPVQHILYDSAPAFHPRQPLLVWPLGDQKILFADYEQNKYFVRKFPTSEFWSTHISVSCRFSGDGNHLHVVALEKLGNALSRISMGRKNKNKNQMKTETLKPQEPKYEVVVSTYRMSKRKTTKVPPILVGRVQKNLGELDTLPTVTWTGECAFVTATQKMVCAVHRFEIEHSGARRLKTNGRGNISHRHMTINLPEWALHRKILFSDGKNLNDARLVIATRGTAVPPFKPKTVNETEETVEHGAAETLKAKAAADPPPVDSASQDTEDCKHDSYNGTMIANLSPATIEALGGWRTMSDNEMKNTESTQANGTVRKVDLEFRGVEEVFPGKVA